MRSGWSPPSAFTASPFPNACQAAAESRVIRPQREKSDRPAYEGSRDSAPRELATHLEVEGPRPSAWDARTRTDRAGGRTVSQRGRSWL